jgi:hypothetical protein
LVKNSSNFTLENSSSSKISLLVYNDEHNDTTRIYVNGLLMYSSKYVRSILQLHRLVEKYKEKDKEYDVVYHSYKYA